MGADRGGEQSRPRPKPPQLPLVFDFLVLSQVPECLGFPDCSISGVLTGQVLHGHGMSWDVSNVLPTQRAVSGGVAPMRGTGSEQYTWAPWYGGQES